MSSGQVWLDECVTWADEQAADFRARQTFLMGKDASLFTADERRNYYWWLVDRRNVTVTHAISLRYYAEAGWDIALVEQVAQRRSAALEGLIGEAERVFDFVVPPGKDTQDRTTYWVRTPQQKAEQMAQAAAEAKRLADQPAKDAAMCLRVGAIGFAICTAVGIGYTMHQPSGDAWTWGGMGVGLAYFLLMAGFAWLHKDVYPEHPNAQVAVNAAMVGYAAYQVYEHHEKKQADRIGSAVAEQMKKQR